MEQAQTSVPVIEDISHVMASALKAQFEQTAHYQRFTTLATKAAKALRQTDLAFLVPPKLRSKGRFLSIGKLARWGEKLLAVLAVKGRAKQGSTLARLRTALPGFLKLRPFITTFATTAVTVCELMEVLKNKGLPAAQCRQLAAAADSDHTTPPRLARSSLPDQHQLTDRALIVSSDIIESLFGNFKYILERSPQADMNRTALLLPMLCGDLNPTRLANALEHTSHNDLIAWEKEHIPYTQRKKRAAFTALSDPIHGTFYKQVAGEPTEEGVVLKSSGKYPVCLQCHAPNAAIDKTTKLDAMAAYSEGVNCVACHTLKTYNGILGEDGKLRLGLKAYEISDEIQAPAGINNGLAKLAATSDDLFGGAGVGDESQKPNPHLGEPVELEGLSIPALPMQSNPRLMKTSDACMGCHDQRNNAHGVPLCQTGNEYMSTGSEVSCLSCHMPVSGGIADHTMGGGHNHDILKRSVVFDVDTESAGDLIKATVFMKNQQPHAMPTGAPFRNIYVKLTAYDESGNPVWQSSEDHPAKERPTGLPVLRPQRRPRHAGPTADRDQARRRHTPEAARGAHAGLRHPRRRCRAGPRRALLQSALAWSGREIRSPAD
jgi:hypothetical protein